MKEKFSVLHNSEVSTFFEKIGLLEKLNTGGIKCSSCGAIITLENFRMVYKEKNELKFICDNETCTVFASSKLS